MALIAEHWRWMISGVSHPLRIEMVRTGKAMELSYRWDDVSRRRGDDWWECLIFQIYIRVRQCSAAHRVGYRRRSMDPG